MNDGAVISKGNFIYFISYLLGDIFTFNSDGEEIAVKTLSGLKGKLKNETIIYKQGLRRNSDGTITTPSRVVQDATLAGNDLFLLITGYGLNGEDHPVSYYEIWKLNPASLSIKSKYVLSAGGIEIEHLCALSNQKEDAFYISFYDKNKEENLIGLLIKEDVK